MILRDYQIEALQKLFDYWRLKLGKNPLISAPTGSGKSLIIAEFIRSVQTQTPSVRILVVTHVKELIEQNRDELIKHWEDARTGIYSAGLDERNTWAPTIFAGIQSIYKHVSEFGRIDVVIVDEAHLIPRTSDTRYQKFISEITKLNPKVVIWGATATPYRLDSGLLTEGKDAIFDGVAYNVDMKKLIADGYLVPVVSKGGVMKIDLHDVHVQAGEYNAKELAHAADDPQLVKLAVEEIVSYGKDRKAWLIFASGILHAEHVMEEIQKYGVECKIITGETPDDEREKTVREFREGKIRCIVNVMVLTTGFNAPPCDLIALLTATQSTGKYVQMVGRGMRTNPGKTNCLLLDYGQNVLRHGPIDEVDPVNRKNVVCEIKKAPPMKECPKCHVIIHARTTICPACQYEFPVVAPHGTEAYDGAVISTQQEAFFVDIAEDGFYVSRHTKAGKPDMAKIEFSDGLQRDYNIYLCLNHGGFASQKAQAVVRTFGGKATTTDEALKEWNYWKKPIRIKVVPEGKFTRVVGVVFEDPEAPDKETSEEATNIKVNVAVESKCGQCNNCTAVHIKDKEVGFHCNVNEDYNNCKSYDNGVARFADGQSYAIWKFLG
jgi:DNA repair protein RadD